MDQRSMYSSASQPSVLQTNKVLRNTYMLLAMTLAFSAVCAGVAMAVGISPMMSLGMTIGAFITLFVVQKKADTSSGIFFIFKLLRISALLSSVIVSSQRSIPKPFISLEQ